MAVIGDSVAAQILCSQKPSIRDYRLRVNLCINGLLKNERFVSGYRFSDTASR